jgi:hypothetical protein
MKNKGAWRKRRARLAWGPGGRAVTTDDLDRLREKMQTTTTGDKEGGGHDKLLKGKSHDD